MSPWMSSQMDEKMMDGAKERRGEATRRRRGCKAASHGLALSCLCGAVETREWRRSGKKRRTVGTRPCRCGEKDAKRLDVRLTQTSQPARPVTQSRSVRAGLYAGVVASTAAASPNESLDKSKLRACREGLCSMSRPISAYHTLRQVLGNSVAWERRRQRHHHLRPP